MFADSMIEDETIRTSLNIYDVKDSDIQTIKFLMADKRRVKGGAIKTFNKVNHGSNGVYKINVIYEEDTGEWFPKWLTSDKGMEMLDHGSLCKKDCCEKWKVYGLGDHDL